MDISTVINILLCLFSFILAAISVITVVITLRQNRKMIESSTRPYLSIYYGYTYFQSMQHYLILKNYGSSSATIIEFLSNYDFSKIAFDKQYPAFTNISGTVLAPGQKIVYPINGTDFVHNGLIDVKIKYKSSANCIYSESISIKPDYISNTFSIRAAAKNEELKTISFALQDIAEKML